MTVLLAALALCGALWRPTLAAVAGCVVALAHAAFDAGLVAAPMSTVAEALPEICERNDPDMPAPRILIGGPLYLVGNVLADNGTPPK